MLKARRSIAVKVSTVFLVMALLNALLLWSIFGANQMKLMAEKANLTAANFSRQLKEDFAVHFPAAGGLLPVAHFTAEKSQQAWSRFQSGFEFTIFTGTGEVLFNGLSGIALKVGEKVPGHWMHAAFKAEKLRSFDQGFYYSVPNLISYTIEIFLPVYTARDGSLFLYSPMRQESLKAEFLALVRFGAVSLVLLLLLQGAVALYIHRGILTPIRSLSRAMSRFSADGHIEENASSQPNDEIGDLMTDFTSMSKEIQLQRNKLEENFNNISRINEKMQFELEIAEKIQQAILTSPESQVFREISRTNRPLFSVSGDYHDIFPLPDQSSAIVIADASGHGVPAALLTIMVKVYFTSLSQEMMSPGKLLEEINMKVGRSLEGSGQYLTACYMRLYQDGFMEYCNGSHPSPLLWRARLNVCEELESSGFFIGLLTELPFPFENRSIRVEKGDRLLLYTDGLTESTNLKGEMYGAARLQDVFLGCAHQSPEQIKSHILADFEEFCGETKVRDDLTLVILEIGALESSNQQRLPDSYKGRNTSQEDDDSVDLQLRARESVQSQPRGEEFLYHADIQFKHGKYEAALRLFREYLAHAGHDERIALKVGICLTRMNRYEEAIAAFSTVIEENPSCGEAYARRAVNEMRLGWKSQALDDVDRALQLNPRDTRYRKIHDRVQTFFQVEKVNAE